MSPSPRAQRSFLFCRIAVVSAGAVAVCGVALASATAADGPVITPSLGEVAGEYTLELLAPTSGGVTANALGINDVGDVVGISRPTASAQPQVTVLWERHGDHFHVHELANLTGSQFSRGFDLDDSRTIVGEAFNSGGNSVPIRWTDGGDPEQVASLNEAGTGILNDIDAGVAVGTASGAAVRLADGTATTLPAPEGTTKSAAASIAGDVIGGTVTIGGILTGAMWDNGQIHLLQTPAGASSPAVAGVADDGVGVGSVTVGEKQIPLYWNADGSYGRLEMPVIADYTHAAAKAVDDGIVVGYAAKFAGNASFGGAAVAWGEDGPVDLNTLVADLPEGVTLQSASDVNASGQIVGSATTPTGSQGFVLTPVEKDEPDPTSSPEPTTTPGDPSPSISSTPQATKSAPTFLKLSVKGKHVRARTTRAKLSVALSTPEGMVPTGTLTIAGKGIKKPRVVTLRVDGTAVVKLPKFKRKGPKKLTVSYSGDDRVLPATATMTVKVEKAMKKDRR